MQKDSKDAEIIFTYRLVDGTKYGLSTGTKRGICTKEFYDFDSVEMKLKRLCLDWLICLIKIRLEHNGKSPRW